MFDAVSLGQLPDTSLQQGTIRPIGVYALSGLVAVGDRLWSIDQVRGYLLEIDPRTNNTTVLNPTQATVWEDAAGLAVWQDEVWWGRGREVLCCDRRTLDQEDLAAEVVVELPYEVDGVAVWESTIYVTCRKSGYIHIFERSTKKLIAKFPQPGVGQESITVTKDALWICDRTEQSVYCLDRTTGQVKFSTLTPFAHPTGIAFQGDLCYIAYADEEAYIRDDPNADSPHQVTWRDRTFIHPLHIYHNAEQHYTLSNGYLVEFSYVEELMPLDDLVLTQVEWRMALPSETVRQRIRQVEAIGGHPLTIVEQDGQKVAVFKFDQLQPSQRGLFGIKVVMEMYSLKYHLTPADVEDCSELPAEFQQRYLVDNDELAMDSEIIRQAAKEAIGTETNVLRKMLKIRNYVYDHLSYGIQPRISTPDVALERGIGSCGEYVGVLLALARLNGIACRTIGRYKCPPVPDRRDLPLEPDFNHVWLEFYLPGVGWLPMESNVDDVIDRGPYPERFFMGLCWYHTEIGKGISFEKVLASNLPEDFSLRSLALNHIRYRILEELVPHAKND
jgi:hypothetical protein